MNEITEVRPTNIIAAEINSIKEQTRKMVLYNSIEIGRRLAEAKLSVPHGEWGHWLKESVDYSQSTANNMIKIFEQYGSNQLSLFGDNAKSQVFGNLSYTQALALIGIPEEEREQFVVENDVESMSTRELQKAIKEKQEIERELKESKEREEKERLAREALVKVNADLEKKTAERDQKLLELNAQLSKSGNDEEVQRLKQSLEKSQSEVKSYSSKFKQLEQELKARPIDVPAVVEKIPEEVEKELSELRKKTSQDKSATKFGVCFERLVSDFKDLLTSLSEISDAETREKYKTAVAGLVGKMSERL